MVIGLVSYPRSGNTLLRLFLAKVFEVNTMSIYNTEDSGYLLKNVGREIHHVDLIPESILYNSPENFFVKTHEVNYPVLSKMIYVVRDGRCAMVSYCHHLNDNGRPTKIEEVISGNITYGSWSNHLNACWEKPGLHLRYEEMVTNPEKIIEQLSEFCEIKPKNKWVNEFDRLHHINPQFFRNGNNEASIAEFELLDEYKTLFWSLHTTWMKKLGYLPEKIG